MKRIFRLIVEVVRQNLLKPKSSSEDKKRKEFILNILLISSEILMLAFLALSLVRELIDVVPEEDRGFKLIIFLIMSLTFIIAHLLSRKGKLKSASLIFLSIFFVPNLYLSYHWGIDLPQSLLLYALTILTSGILLSTKFSLIITAFIGVYLSTLGYLQGHGIVSPNTYWTAEMVTIYDAIPIVITLLIMATISWLSNREIENSLFRALESEKNLKIERDNLEITVKKRTQELQKMQLDKIGQLYRLAEFGRISSSIFHDLINPLTAISLNLEQITKTEKHPETSEQIEQAVSAAKRMEVLIAGVKKQLKQEECQKQFFPSQEIKSMLKFSKYRALKNKIEIKFRYQEEVEMFGDPLKFSQIIFNLVANSLDALESCPQEEKRINVKLGLRNNNDIFLTVKDNGPGIKEEIIQKIFDSFFSTKNGKGLGLGLSSIKHLVEKSFHGTISVKNLPEKGCIFTVLLPKNNA